MRFRRQLLISDCILFLIFMALLLPCVERTISHVVRKSLDKRGEELLAKIEKEPNIEGVYEYLCSENAFLFMRVSVFDLAGEILYDACLAQPKLAHEKENPEVLEALKYGRGYSDRYSDAFRQSIAYAAFPFEMQGREYVLRMGIPFGELKELIRNCEIGFSILGGMMLLLYSLMAWAIMHRFSVPIQQIIERIAPYQEGKEELLPKIEIGKQFQDSSEFNKLAATLNSLNERIQKQIEHLVEQKEETEAILATLGEGVIAVDHSGVITFANPAACKMLGVTSDSVCNQTFNDIKSSRAALVDKCHELTQSVLERTEGAVEMFTVEETRKIYFDLIAAPRTQQSGIVLVLQDKTSDYRMIEMGKDFIANASHELRTPITIIRGFAETLHDDLPRLSQDQLAGITQIISKTCIRLDTLVKSLLTLSELDNLSEDQLQPVDANVICKNCIQLLSSADPHPQILLHKKAERAMLRADGDLLEMAIMNLLHNAVKYSPAPAQIELTVEGSGDQIKISVQDRGIGIADMDLPHIFDRFYTVNKARSRKFGGTGLGLSIVRTIVQKHRGNINVASQLGQGTTFTLLLPATK